MALTRPTQAQIRDVTSAINVVSAQANLTVSLIDAVSAISNSFSYIKTLRFDSDAGFDVNDLGGGAVKIGMNSTFKTWKVAGQTDLVATGLDTIELVASNGIILTTNPSGSPYKTLTIAAEVTSAQLVSVDTKLSNAISAVSAQVATNSAQMTSANNAISNAVSIVSAAQLSTQNALSNEISARQAASADLNSAINLVSNAVSVVSAQVATNSAQMVSADNAISNAVSVVSAAQLSTWNKVSAILTSSTTFSGATYSFTGNTNILGNLTVTGAYTILGSNNIAYTDNIIELHTSTNLGALTSDDGKDIGIHIHYFKGTDSHAFLGWDNSTGYLEWQDSGSEGSDTFTGNYGTMRLGNLIANASTAATSTSSGAITTNGGIGVAGNAYVGQNLVVAGTNIINAIDAVSNAVSVVSAAQLSTQNAVSNEISVRAAASAALETHINNVSNAVSVVSAAVVSVESHVNTVSNAVSVVSAAQLSTWNAVSNEISVRAAASAALETHINNVSNAVSVVSAAQLSTQNAVSNEISVRAAASAALETHINNVSNAVSVVSAQVATNSAQMTSADNAISNAVSVVSAAQLSTWNVVSAIKTSSQTFSGATYSYTGSTASSNTTTGTIVVTGGVGVSGAIRTGSLYTDGYYYANGVSFSGSGGGGGSAANSNVENILYITLGTVQAQIDYTTATGIGTVTYLATAKDNVNSNYKSSRITILSDGTTTYLTEFDTVYSNASAEVVSYSSDITSGNIRLLATGDSANVSVQMQKVKLGTSITAGTVSGIVPVTVENFSPFMLMGA